MELREPKRKRGVKIPQCQPLPVVIESESGITVCDSLWPVYVGTFSGDSVIVNASDEMSTLYTMGFFGKGCLSRGYPNFGSMKNGLPSLITERQWKRRKSWMDHLLSFTGASSGASCKASEKNNSTGVVGGGSKESEVMVVDDDVLVVTDAESNKSTGDTTREECVGSQPVGTSQNECSSKTSASGSSPRLSSSTTSGNAETSGVKVKSNKSEGGSKIGSPKSCKQSQDTMKETTLSITKNVAVGSSFVEDDSSSSLSGLQPERDLRHDQSDNNCVIVIEDIDSDDEYRPESLRPRLHNEPIRTAIETLNLTLEEAFFLSFGLGCLQVIDLQGVLLSLPRMWHLYRESQHDFIASYVAYHYFRSKGWIVKPGTKFGANYLLYKEGPAFYHASYVVVIEEANNKFDHLKVKRQVSWSKVMGLNRIAETANKEVLICQVIWPSDITYEDLTNPRVIAKFKVEEVLLRRWNSTLERDGREAT